jgi:glycosyltransferase involved in cell wall biosynthesis
LRILLVTQRFRPLIGGAESVLGELARELVRLNHRVTVVTARWEPNWPIEERVDGVEILRIPFQRIRFLGTWRFMRALKRWLLKRGSGYDIWYVSMLKHCAWSAIGAAWRCHIPVVLRPEGAGPSGDIAWAEQAVGGKLIRRRCRSATAFVAIGPHVREDMERAAFIKSRIHDIPNGVAVPALADDADKSAWRQRLGLHSSAPLAVFIGRLSPEKGLIDLVAAWKQLQAEVPGAQLAIVGAGPQEGELRSIAADQSNIVWVGPTTQPQRYLRAADLFVLPSHEEGMSIALLEAMAAAVPVVATDIPGNRALIEPARDGLLVPRGRPDLLAKSMALQFQQRSSAAEMARAARDRVQKEFSITQMAQRHMELFQSLVSKAHEPTSRGKAR